MPSPILEILQSEVVAEAVAIAIAEKEASTAAHPPPYDLTDRPRQRANPSSLCSEMEAKIHVFCFKCNPRHALTERCWQGRIIGTGLHGSLNALRARIKYMLFRSQAPLMSLLTVCAECCAKMEVYYEVDQVDRIFGFQDKHETPGEMVLRVPYKEIGEIVSSKVIVMKGVLLNAGTINTFSADGKWRKWYLWNQ
jgi:hypothetical protein